MANLWTYNDWRRQPTAAARLDRLRLHIEEVEQQMVGNSARNGASKFPPHHSYWLTLTEKEQALAAQVDPAGLGAIDAPIARLRSRFRRT